MEKLIVLIIFIAISAIRGLMKNAEEKAQKAQRKVAAAGNLAPERQKRVQSEIDAFLSEVGAAPPKPQAPRPAPPRPVPAPPAAQSQSARQRSAANQPRRRQPTRTAPKAQPERRPPIGTPAPSAGRQQVGGSIASHVDQYISKHVTQHLDHDVDELVQADIVDSVNSHLGMRGREMPALTGSAQAVPPADEIVRLLRDPAGIRQAILINEILSRPRALRR